MKHLQFVILLTLAFFLPAMQTSRAEPSSKALKIVFIAYANPDQLVEDVKPVVKYLEEKLDMPIKYFVASDYAAVVEALRYKSADLGFMGPLQYIMAHEQTGAYPILGEVYNGKSSYVSRIFVHRDSPIKTLADLRGKSIAFVDPISSSGYMYPLDIFKRAKLIKTRDDADTFFKKIYFAGGDEQSIRAVVNKFVDAAGIGQYAFSLLDFDERDSIRVIGESQAIPSHCVVVRKELDKKTVKKITDILFALNKGPDRKFLKYLYNVDGYVKVTHSDYKGVAEMARKYEFIK